MVIQINNDLKMAKQVQNIKVDLLWYPQKPGNHILMSIPFLRASLTQAS